MEIRLPECVIRSYCTSDAASLARYANNRNVWRNLTDLFPHPYALADAKAFIAKAITAGPETNFALEIEGEAAGGIAVQPKSDVYRRTAQVGYWIAEPYWGRGIATAAVKAITARAIKEHHLLRIEAGVYAWNPASARVLEKAGYAFEGRLRKSVFKDNEIVDQLMYAYVV